MDLEPLTPAHFLIGEAFTSTPEPDYQQIQLNRLDKYQRIVRAKQDFWSRWTAEYLPRLQTRPKWIQPTRDFKENDLVLLMDDNVPRQEWTTARIVRVLPGEDNHVRSVILRTKTGYKNGELKYKEYKRPITKIALLPLYEESEEN